MDWTLQLATSAGKPHRANEDFVGAVPGAVVLLDGAGIPGTEDLCHHGVAWYTSRIGAALLARLTGVGRDLGDALAEAIEQISSEHRSTCDVANPSSPQATVAMFRLGADAADFLMLADSFLVLDRAVGEPQVVTDEREVAVRRECSAALAGVAPGTDAYARAREDCSRALRARRNQPGGYWLAKDDPQAAAQAVRGSVSMKELAGAALLTNGASRIVDPYGLTDWPGVLDLLRSGGPGTVICRVREFEGASPRALRQVQAPAPDDATVAYSRAAGS